MTKKKQNEINALLAEYRKEYKRVNGRDIEITCLKGWVTFQYNTGGSSKYRLTEVPTFIARLKARPDFQSTPQTSSPTAIVVALLQKTPTSEHSDLMRDVLASVPNVASNDVEFRFSGWNIKLHPNGTWTVADTGGLLKNS